MFEQNRHRPVGDLFGSKKTRTGIGFAAVSGACSYPYLQIKPGAIPFDVIEIIMAVIVAIAAMQVAGRWAGLPGESGGAYAAPSS